MRWIQWLAAAAFCMAASEGVADSMFNSISVSVAEQHVDGEVASASGVQLAFEKTLADEFLIGGSLARFEPDGADHTQHASAYVGLHAAVTRMPNTQVAALFGARQSQLVFDVPALDDLEDKAGMIAVSLRNRAFDHVELRADLEYLDWREGESGFAGLLGASYFLSKAVAAHVNFRKQGDSEFYALGLGVYF